MMKKFHRLAAIVLCLIMVFQMIPAGIITTLERDGGSKNESDAATDAVDDTIAVEDVDFSTKRLLIGTEDPSIFTEDANVIAEFGYVYLLEFDDVDATVEAYTYYLEIADFVDADIALFLADDDFVDADGAAADADADEVADEADNAEDAEEVSGDGEETDAADVEDDNASDLEADTSKTDGVIAGDQTEVSDDKTSALPEEDNDKGSEKVHYDVAIIDSGVPNGTVASATVLGGEGIDDNGHGTATLEAIKGVSEDLSVLSIKAFDSHGIAYLSDVYVAVLFAAEQDVDVISMPFAGERKTGGASLRYAISVAREKGIIVVGAAGNDGADTAGYLPGRIEEVVTVGACDADGVRLSASNYGDDVYCNVAAGSTSEAAAKLAAIIAVNGVDYVNSEKNNGVIFDKNYGVSDAETSYGEDGLVEVAATDDDPLLADSELTSATLEAIDRPAVVSDDDPDDATGEEPDKNTPPDQDPVTEDNTTIERLYVRWLSTGDHDDSPAYFGPLDLYPDSEYVTDQQFQIDFALSGQAEYAPGEIELTFPASLWDDRNGDEPGYLTLAVPESGTSGAEFVWTRKGDKIVITNAKPISSASKVMIQGTFRGLRGPDMVDGTKSIDFDVTLTVQTPHGYTVTQTSNAITASVDTSVKVSYASKTAYNATEKKYDYWWGVRPDGIPNALLANLDGPVENYGFIRWYVAGTATGSQPFDMYIEDTIEENGYEGIMLGVSHAAKTEDHPDGVYVSEDGEYVKALLYEGYTLLANTAYVWTAYPIDKFPEEPTVVTNTQTVTVEGKDDHEESSMSAPAQVETKAPSTYKFVKHWDDLADLNGVRPTRLGLRIYYDGMLWESLTLGPGYAQTNDVPGKGNDWTYTWTDGGLPGNFEVEEILYDASGIWDYRYDESGHQLEWDYILEYTNYDPDTHTFNYTNRYDEGWIKFDISTINKSVQYEFRDSALVSTRDGLSLNKLLKGEDVSVQYPVTARISVAKPSVWYGVKPNRFVLEDVEYFLNNNKNLTVEDVDIGAVILTNPRLCRYLDYDQVTGWYNREFYEAEEATLYGLMNVNGTDTWLEMARLKNGVIASTSNGANSNGMRVNLPLGVARVKLELESDLAFVDMSYTVELRVHPSPAVIEMLEKGFENEDYIRFPLYNKANAYAVYLGTEEKKVDWYTYNYGDRVSDMYYPITGYMHGRQFKVATDLEKSFEIINNDLINRRVKMRSELTLTQQSNATTRADYDDAIASDEIPNTKSGTYYDLLPYGVEPILSTVKAGGRDRIENVRVVQNYKDTGRVLLIVKVGLEDNISYTLSKKYPSDSTYPKEGYKNTHTITFDSYCTWITVRGYEGGIGNMRNVAAYEADEDIIGTYENWSGEPDDPTPRDIDAPNGKSQHIQSSEAVGADAELMKDLDPDRDDFNFVYAGAPLENANPDTFSVAELTKRVSVAGTGYWSNGENDDVNVQEEGLYTYRLYLATTKQSTSEMILFDSLENYVPVNLDRDVDDTQWRGDLVSIDLTQVREMGVDPIVYYSTVPHLDVGAYGDISTESTTEDIVAHFDDLDDDGNPVWSQDPPADLGEVTAIAIDMRTRTDGAPFVLGVDEALVVYLNMRAPYEIDPDDPEGMPDYFNGTNGTDHMKNAHAYNQAHLNCVQRDLTDTTHGFIDIGYTKVGIFTKEATVVKAWDDDNNRDGKRPGSVTVELFADDDSTGQIVTLDESNDWTGYFHRLKTYNEEDKSPINYTYHETFDNDDLYEQKVSREVQEDGTILVTLTNYHEPEKIKIPVTKLWGDDNENIKNTRPESITVRLYADDVFTGKTLTIRPDTNGNWYGEFTGLERYRDQGEEIVYTITEDAVDDYVFGGIEGSIENGEGSFTVTNNYYPYGNLSVTKRVINSTTAADANEFIFNLELWIEENDQRMDVTKKYSYTIKNAAGEEIESGEIGSGDRFKLKIDETLLIENIETHVRYSITEETATAYELTGTVNDSGEIISWSTAAAEFTNTYSSVGYIEIEAMKFISGRTIRNHQFRFDLIDPDGNSMVSAYNDKDGKIEFGRIGFTNLNDGDTLYYKLVEYDAGNGGYTYDETVYIIEIKPHDNGDGTMTINYRYLNEDMEEVSTVLGDTTYDIPVFKNKYEASGKIELRAWKDLDGRDVTDGEFTFDIFTEKDGKYVLVVSASNDADGVVYFPSISFNELDAEHTYWYFARERIGEDDTVEYTDRVLGYYIEVKDNNDGTLSFNQSTYDMTEFFTPCEDCERSGKVLVGCENCGQTGLVSGVSCEVCGGTGRVPTDCDICNGFGYIRIAEITKPEEAVVPVFENGLADGALSVSKYIDDASKNDPALADKEFRFRVKFTGPNIEDGEFVYDITPARKRPFPDTSGYPASSSTAVSEVSKTIVSAVKETLSTTGSEIMPVAGEVGGTNDGIIWSIDEKGTLTIELEDSVNGAWNALYTYDSMARKYTTPWYDYREQIVSVQTKGRMAFRQNGTMMNIFVNCVYLKDISGIAGWDTSNLVTMSLVFDGCTSLQDISAVGSWNTSNLREISSVFKGCTALKDISALSNWKTGNAVTISSVFSGCTALTDISALSSWDTSRVTTLSNVFSGCTALTDISALSSWDTSKVTNMSSLFSQCTSLSDLSGISGWNTENVTMLPSAFTSTAITNLDALSKWNTRSLELLAGTFTSCTKLSDISGLANWNAVKISNMGGAFQYCNSLTDASPLGKWHLKGPGTFAGMFANCSNLTVVDMSNWDTTGVTNINGPFATDNNISKITFGQNSLKFVGAMANLGCSFSETDVSTGRWIRIEEQDAEVPTATFTFEELKGQIGTFVLQSKPTVYTVNFEAPGASGLMAPQKAVAANSYTLPTNVFVKHGYIFAGWQDKNDPEKKFDVQTGDAYIISGGKYNPGDNVTLIPIWVPGDTVVTSKDGVVEFTLKGGERAVFKNLPAGTTYQVWEETEEGWVLVQQVDASGVIQPLETASAEFYNLYRPNMTSANIVANKIFDNKHTHTDNDGNAFLFELLDENGDRVQLVPATNGGFVQFDPIFYTETGTYKYTLREIPGGNTNIVYDDKVISVTVTVTENAGGTLTSTVSYDPGAAEFVNKTEPGRLEISKVGEGMTENTINRDFTFKIKFYNANGIPVSGETFKWYIVDSVTGEVISGDTAENGGTVGGGSGGGESGGNSGDEADKNADYKTNEVPADKNELPADKDELHVAMEDVDDDQATTDELENEESFGKVYAATIGYEPSTKGGAFTTLFDAFFYLIQEPGGMKAEEYPVAPLTLYGGDLNSEAHWTLDTVTGVLRIYPKNGVSAEWEPDYSSSYFKVPWFSISNYAKSLRTDGEIILKGNADYLFYYCTNLSDFAGLENWKAEGIKTMKETFYASPIKKVPEGMAKWNLESLESMYETFYSSAIETLDGLENWNTQGNLVSLERTFYNAHALTDISALRYWNIENVTNMNGTFQSCRELVDLNPISGWNTENVTNMDATFEYCLALSDFKPISGWNTDNVKSMEYTFSYLEKLEDLAPISVWNTENVESMAGVFCACTGLENLKGLENWNVGKVTDMRGAFNECTALEDLSAISGWKTSKVTSMSYMFYKCTSLEDLTPIAGWNTGSLTNMDSMFSYCAILESLTGLESWNVENVETMKYICQGCDKLENISALSGWNTKSLKYLDSAFENCSVLERLSGLQNWNVGNLETLTYTFDDCIALKDVSALANWNPVNLQTMYHTFSYCSSLETVEIRNWDVKQLTTMEDTFYRCTSLKTLDLSGWQTDSLNNMAYTFGYCEALTDASSLADWNVESLENMKWTFYCCTSLETIDFSNWQTNSLTTLDSTFYGCDSLVDTTSLANWNTSGVTTMNRMFDNCDRLNKVDFSGWDTGRVTTMHEMFYECRELTEMNTIGNWDMTSVTDMHMMFGFCTKLREVDISGWDTSRINYDGYRYFYFCYNLSKITIGPKSLMFIGGKFDYVFDGWSRSQTTNYESYTQYWIPESEEYTTPVEDAERYTGDQIYNMKLVGTYIWQQYLYTVSFDGNGGFGYMAEITEKSGDDLVLPANTFVRPGFRFTGWLDESLGEDGEFYPLENGVVTIPGGTYGKNAAVKPTINLKAQWEATEFDEMVPYYVNRYQQNVTLTGYELAATDVYYAYPGDEVCAEVISYDGFKSPDAQTVTIPEDSVIYVDYQYDRLYYTIHFEGNGADSGSMADMTMLGGIGVVLGNGYGKTDSIFNGWNTKEDGSGTMYSAVAAIKGFDDADVKNGEITLYAQWITLDNEVVPSQGEIIITCKAGQTIVIPDLPAGTIYEIEEIDVPFGWAITDEANVDGTIIPKLTSKASVTNRYSARGTVALTAHKNLEGATLGNGMFEFELWDINPGQMPTPINISTISHSTNVADDGTRLSDYDNNSNYLDVVTMPGMKSLHIEIDVQTESNWDYVYIFKGNHKGDLDRNMAPTDDMIASITSETYGAPITRYSFDVEGDTVTFGFYSDSSGNSGYYGYHAVISADSDPLQTKANGDPDPITGSVGDDNVFVENKWYNWAPVQFDLIEFTAPGEYVYYIREKTPEHDPSLTYDPTVKYDNHVEKVTVVVTDNGDGTLATTVVYDGVDENGVDHDGAPFDNKMKPGSLTVSKTLRNATGAVTERLFEFRIKLTDSSGNALSGKYSVEKSDGTTDELIVTNGESENTITIKGGQSFTVNGLPHGAIYEVTELDSQSFELLSSEGSKGTIESNNESKADFINVYTASAQLELTAVKNFIGGTIGGANTFEFELVDESGVVIQKVAAGADGVIRFAPIDFTQADVGDKPFIYRIREVVDESREDIDYDTHVEVVQVRVTNDEDGQIIVTAEIDADGLEFTNVALCDLVVSKTVEGVGAEGEEFSFILTLDAGDNDLSHVTWYKSNASNLLETLKSSEGDWYEFTLRHGETIRFSGLPGGTTYTIKEADCNYDTVITTTVNGESFVVSGRETTGVLDDSVYVDYVNNNPVVLPIAGGIGMIPIYASGIALITLAGAWFFLRRRRRVGR